MALHVEKTSVVTWTVAIPYRPAVVVAAAVTVVMAVDAVAVALVTGLSVHMNSVDNNNNNNKQTFQNAKLTFKVAQAHTVAI